MWRSTYQNLLLNLLNIFTRVCVFAEKKITCYKLIDLRNKNINLPPPTHSWNDRNSNHSHVHSTIFWRILYKNTRDEWTDFFGTPETHHNPLIICLNNWIGNKISNKNQKNNLEDESWYIIIMCSITLCLSN